MTEKQQERIRLKIKKIKSALAADKKHWGGFYDDSRGLRYLPLEYYIKLKDYSGGKRYINWFYKNFPDDGGFPDFLFQCTIVLFYSNEPKEAKRKLFETFSSNIYIIDKFLGNKIHQIEKHEGSNIEGTEYLNYINYSSADENLTEFTKWLIETYNSDLFKSAVNEFIYLQRQLKAEREYEKRVDLVNTKRALVDRL
jgi:hypothetical protein